MLIICAHHIHIFPLKWRIKFVKNCVNITKVGNFQQEQIGLQWNRRVSCFDNARMQVFRWKILSCKQALGHHAIYPPCSCVEKRHFRLYINFMINLISITLLRHQRPQNDKNLILWTQNQRSCRRTVKEFQQLISLWIQLYHPRK